MGDSEREVLGRFVLRLSAYPSTRPTQFPSILLATLWAITEDYVYVWIYSGVRPDIHFLSGLFPDELADVKVEQYPSILPDLREFWQNWDTAQRLLDELPEDALQEISRLTGKPWNLATRRTLDALAQPILRARPRTGPSDDLVTQDADLRRIFVSLSDAEFSTWPALVTELKQLSLDLQSTRGRPYWAEVAQRADVLVSQAPAAKPQDAAGGDDDQDTAHGDDFRSVRWYGEVYEFTATQAACVKVLWEHWKRGTPVVGEPTILEAADSSSNRLRDVFDKGRHPAWDTMIVEARKGAFRLHPKTIADGAA
jgi:hypothetical protein